MERIKRNLKNDQEEYNMAKLVVFYSRADENYFSGAYRYIPVGNTEKVANMVAEMTGAVFIRYKTKSLSTISRDML